MVKSPGWTQTPNDVLGHIRPGGVLEPGLMAKMTESQLKLYLAILRVTVGYHTGERELSVAEMCTLTGLAANSVKAAAKELEKMKLARRRVRRNRSYWAAVFSDYPSVNPETAAAESATETEPAAVNLAPDSEAKQGGQNLTPRQNLTRQNLTPLRTEFDGSSYKERKFKRKSLHADPKIDSNQPENEVDSEREIKAAFIENLKALNPSPPAGLSESGRQFYQSCQQVAAACARQGAPLGEAELRALLKAVQRHQPPAIIAAYEQAVMAGANSPWPYTIAILSDPKRKDSENDRFNRRQSAANGKTQGTRTAKSRAEREYEFVGL